jgi:ATP-dependent Clp protease ATP-binding subunit ClpA
VTTRGPGPRWTRGARDVLAAARARSNARNDWLITDLDLLHALLGGDQAVQALLAGAGVDMVALRRRVDAHSDARAEDADAAANAHLTYSDAVAEALERATHLAIVGGHIRVDTVHLLAALAQSRRSAAQLLLRDAGASLWAIERATHRTAEASSDNPAGATLPPRRVRPGSDTVGGGARTIVTKVGRILRRYLQLANGA